MGHCGHYNSNKITGISVIQKFMTELYIQLQNREIVLMYLKEIDL